MTYTLSQLNLDRQLQTSYLNCHTLKGRLSLVHQMNQNLNDPKISRRVYENRPLLTAPILKRA